MSKSSVCIKCGEFKNTLVIDATFDELDYVLKRSQVFLNVSRSKMIMDLV